MDKELDANIKAHLISIGSVKVDDSLFPDKLESKATAGPGAGGTSIFLKSGNRRVRLTINNLSPLHVETEDEHVVVMKGDEVIARGVLERPLCHCPEQAYITLSEKCIYDCQFCPVPKMQGGIKDISKVLQMVEEAYSTGELKAISLTSGVAVSPRKEVQKGIKLLTGRCIIPILRPISPHPLRKNIKINRPDAARLLKLGGMLKDMLERQSLCVEKSRTVYLQCTGCDLTPGKDI